MNIKERLKEFAAGKRDALYHFSAGPHLSWTQRTRREIDALAELHAHPAWGAVLDSLEARKRLVIAALLEERLTKEQADVLRYRALGIDSVLTFLDAAMGQRQREAEARRQVELSKLDTERKKEVRKTLEAAQRQRQSMPQARRGR